MIELRDVTVSANGLTILDAISLRIDRHSRIAFLGRSGAGKTTALKTINGLVTPARGEVLVNGTPLPQHDLVALRRRIGYVMQQPALFPHRTVFDNIATVPRLLGWKEERIRAEAERLLSLLGLTGFAERHPRMLSGGEQQRVAIARALIAGPDILLCDEPFSALDPIIRAELQTLLLETTYDTTHDTTHDTTLVFVTHDVREALRIAQRVVVFERGRIVADTPSAGFTSHDHPLVQQFTAALLVQ